MGDVRMLLWRDGAVRDVPVRMPEAGETGWVHLVRPTAEELQAVFNLFHCHPLAVEDALHFGQRPKLDHYESLAVPQSFISFYAVGGDLDPREFCVVVSPRFIVTVIREDIPEVTGLYERAATSPERMETPGRLLYHILDACVDGYFAMVDSLEERLDQFEQRVFDHPEDRIAPDIFRLKRRLLRVRRIVSECRNVVGALAHESFPYTDEHHLVYFVDVFDHASRIVDALDAVRDNLSGLLDLQASQRANRMNEIMKMLTIFSTIFLPLTFITGLYGMNIQVPEYHWRFGYAYVWCLLLAVTGAMVYYFKRKGWW